MSIEAPRFSMMVKPESGNEVAEGMDSYIEKGIDQALSLVKERYEERAESSENLPFHNVNHTEGVIRRTESVLSAIRDADSSLVGERDIAIGRFAAACHDTVQRWEENKVADGQFVKVLRRRFVGDNEKASADESTAIMDRINNEGDIVFSEDDKTTIREALDSTVPGWDPVNKTVLQPKLSDEGSLIARAVALADLGTAGMEGPEAFVSEGNALFREENLDILEAINEGAMSVEKKEYFKQRMVNWLKSQPGFARGRQARLETELQAIPETARKAVASLFNKFEASIVAAEETALTAEKMQFEELAESMGY